MILNILIICQIYKESIIAWNYVEFNMELPFCIKRILYQFGHFKKYNLSAWSKKPPTPKSGLKPDPSYNYI